MRYPRCVGVISAMFLVAMSVSSCIPSDSAIEFPTGSFVSANGVVMVEFNEDGTGRWYSEAERWEVPIKYAANGDLYTEMTFEWPSGSQVPATYYWTYDGKNLTFELWGEDMRPHRKLLMDGQTLTKVK
jgi:hypothetical protein